MKAVLSLEIIGDDFYSHARQEGAKESQRYHKYPDRFGADKKRPWVARITGTHPKYQLAREFLCGQKDYSRSNGLGSRGVYEYFVLDPGIYEVHERLTWKRTRRYFVRVQGEEVTEIDREEVLHCLKTISGSAS